MNTESRQSGFARFLERIWTWLHTRFGRTATSSPSTTVDEIPWADLIAWFRQPHVRQAVSGGPERVAFTMLFGPDSSSPALRGLHFGARPLGYSWTLVQGVYDEREESVLEPYRVVHAQAIDDEVRAAHAGKALVLYR